MTTYLDPFLKVLTGAFARIPRFLMWSDDWLEGAVNNGTMSSKVKKVAIYQTWHFSGAFILLK